MTKEQLEQKLKTRFFIAGGGAWQDLWETDKSPMGFMPESHQNDIEPSSKELKESIRPELLKRFRSKVLVMQSMTVDDYKQLIPEFANALPAMIKHRFIELAENGIDTAVEEQLGMRYFEEILTQFLTEYINSNIPTKSHDLENK